MKSEKTSAARDKISEENGFVHTVRFLIKNYREHNVARNAASLAYYMLFTMFPLLIFLSNLLGKLHLDVAYVSTELSTILPKDIVNLISSYLEYVSQTSSGVLLWFSLVFTIWFPMRAAGGLMDDVRRAYQFEHHEKPLLYRIKQLAFTVVLLVVIALTLILSTLGQWIVGYLIDWIPAMENLNISDTLLNLWQYLRFIIVAFVMLATIVALYILPLDRGYSIRSVLPGVLAALTAWLIVSICFSFYVDNFANYSVIYGTLGAVIALLIWLYMSSVILIMGAEMNALLEKRRKNK